MFFKKFDFLTEVKSPIVVYYITSKTWQKFLTYTCFVVTRYSTQTEKIRQIIHSNWTILKSDPSLRTVYPEPHLMSHKWALTIKEKWSSRAQRGYVAEEALRCLRCIHCSNVTETIIFLDFETGRTYNQGNLMNCNTTSGVLSFLLA